MNYVTEQWRAGKPDRYPGVQEKEMNLVNISITLFAIGGAGTAVWKLTDVPEELRPLMSLVGVASVLVTVCSAILGLKQVVDILTYRAPDIAEFHIGNSAAKTLRCNSLESTTGNGDRIFMRPALDIPIG
jgi:hypothetical protein